MMKLNLKTLSLALISTVSFSAQAFLTDTSNQRVVLIGKGGTQNMQAIQVDGIQTPPPQLVQQITTTTTIQPTSQHPQRGKAYIGATYNQSQQSHHQEHVQSPASNYASSYNNYASNYNNDHHLFEQLALKTKSAAVAVVDAQTGRTIYQKNVDATRSIASITKMMTAMVVIDSGEDLAQELVVSRSDLVGAKKARTRLQSGDRMSRSEFMLLMLMKSENPAAKTLASHYHYGYDAFIAAMNKKAQSLGMTSTHFSDASGLNPRNVSSASDLVKMMQEIGRNPRYQTIRNFSSAPSYDFAINNYNSGLRTYSAASTSPLVRSGSYPISASKTGFIREAGYCVVMETQVNGRPAIVVLLGADKPDNRWSDAKNIITQLAYL